MSKGERIAAFMVEPIQGEAGVIVPDDNYLPQVSDLYGIIYYWQLMRFKQGLDELVLFAHQLYNIKPDIMGY